jgi:hypothetical protein
MNSQKGFLFTLGIIFFASTLIFYAQGFYESTQNMERKVISSSTPLNIIQLNEDLAFDLLNIFNLSFDVNSLNNSVKIIGESSFDYSEVDSINSFYSFLNSTYFLRSTYSKTLDLSNLLDGKAEFFLGSNTRFDYNYSDSIVLYSTNSSPLNQVDLIIKTNGVLSSYEWIESINPVNENNFSISINYSDDSNIIVINKSVDNNSLSYLNLIYPDGNFLIKLGSVSVGGIDYNGVISIKPNSSQLIEYELDSSYKRAYLYPVLINSILSVSSDKFDSNSFIKLFK